MAYTSGCLKKGDPTLACGTNCRKQSLQVRVERSTRKTGSEIKTPVTEKIHVQSIYIYSYIHTIEISYNTAKTDIE